MPRHIRDIRKYRLTNDVNDAESDVDDDIFMDTVDEPPTSSIEGPVQFDRQPAGQPAESQSAVEAVRAPVHASPVEQVQAIPAHAPPAEANAQEPDVPAVPDDLDLPIAIRRPARERRRPNWFGDYIMY